MMPTQPSATSAPTHPTCDSSHCVSGSSANWPNEPAAAEMPSAMLRFSGGNARPSDPAITLNVTPDSPVPISTPAASTNVSSELGYAIHMSPATYSKAPAITTRAVPYLSASIPVNGCVAPQARFCTASASANVSRPQCISADMGCRNRPKPWRMPMASVRIRPPQTSTTVGVRQEAGAAELPCIAVIGYLCGGASCLVLAGCSASSSPSVMINASSLSAPT